MQKATEQSYLSGPPIKDAQAGAVSPQRVDVFSISLETVIEKLDSIEIELEKGQPDTMKIVSDLRQGQASLKQAQKNIECPDWRK